MDDFTRRLARVKYEFPLGVTLICEIIMFFIGVTLLIDVVTPLATIPRNSPWHHWGDPGELVFGIVFFALGAYGALYRERQTGLIPTFLLVGIGILQSIHPFNAIGFIFYLTFLAGGIADSHTRYVRARLHRQWQIMVPRGKDDG